MCNVYKNKACRYDHTDPVGQGPMSHSPTPSQTYRTLKTAVIIIIIKIIIIIAAADAAVKRNWVVTRWQWLFYMHTKYEIGCY